MFNFFKKAPVLKDELTKLIEKIHPRFIDCPNCHSYPDRWGYVRVASLAYYQDDNADKQNGDEIRCRCKNCGYIQYIFIEN